MCMDSEQYNWSPAVSPPVDGSSAKAAVRRKNELIYNVTRAAFPDKASHRCAQISRLISPEQAAHLIGNPYRRAPLLRV